MGQWGRRFLLHFKDDRGKWQRNEDDKGDDDRRRWQRWQRVIERRHEEVVEKRREPENNRSEIKGGGGGAVGSMVMKQHRDSVVTNSGMLMDLDGRGDSLGRVGMNKDRGGDCWQPCDEELHGDDRDRGGDCFAAS